MRTLENCANRVDGLLMVYKNYSFKFCGVDGATSRTRSSTTPALKMEMVHATVWRDVLAASGAGCCRISRYNEKWVIRGGAWLAPGANVSAVREFCAVQEFCGGARAALRGICGETDQDGLPLTFKYLCHLEASGWHAFVATARARGRSWSCS